VRDRAPGLLCEADWINDAYAVRFDVDQAR
jgi:hypothetical protein